MQTLFERILDQPLEKSERPTSHNPVSDSKIAVIGMSVKIAGAGNYRQFWQLIAGGTDCIRSLPPSRKQDYLDIMQHKAGEWKLADVSKACYLDRIDLFDNTFFRISPREAKIMDPNQRLLLQSFWETLEDAAYAGERIENTNTGVFVGFSSDFGEEYKSLLSGADPELLSLSVSGNVKSIIPGRLAHFLNLKGPSILVDTACSSALTAVHMACNSLARGECEMAFAGTAKIELLRIRGIDGDINTEARDFRCKSFDNRADGMGCGEGIISLLLKPLSTALADRDNIHVVILASAVNQDGSSVNITAPNPEAQENLLLKVWEQEKINPETISYIEAHGSGTPLGDSIEIQGLTRAFSKYTSRKQFCALGSVKASIGHLDHAAGLAGLAAAILAIKHRTLPPLVHFRALNRNSDLIASPLYISDTAQPWPQNPYPRRCGVSSFGLSGTNCHVLLEEPPQTRQEDSGQEGPLFFPFSAKYPEGVKRLVSDFLIYLEREADHFAASASFRDLSYTLATGRKHFECRLLMTAAACNELLNKLRILHQTGIRTIEEQNIWSGECRSTPAGTVAEGFDSQDLSAEPVDKVCRLYISGHSLNWTEFFDPGCCRKLCLPAYPFQQQRHWFTPLERYQPDRITDSAHFYLAVKKITAENCWIVAEHHVLDVPTVPGTYLIELLYGAAKQITGAGCIAIEKLYFLKLIQFPAGGSKEIHISIKKKNLAFNIFCQDNGSWTEHASGKFSARSGNEPAEMNPAKLLETMPWQEYVESEDSIIRLGKHWDCVAGYAERDTESLAEIVLPREFEAELENFTLHPALFDWAVNMVIRRVGEGHFLPFSYKEILIHRPLPARFYSYLMQKRRQARDIVLFDIILMDEAGRVLVEISDYAIKMMNPAGEHNAQLLHTLAWTRKPAAGGPPSGEYGYVVVIDRNRNLLDGLRVPGGNLELFDGLENPDDYSKIPVRQGAEQTVLYNLMDDELRELPAAQYFDNRVKEVFCLLKALTTNRNSAAVRLIILLRNCFQVEETDPINPVLYALSGLCQVINVESRKLSCYCVELDKATGAGQMLHDCLANRTDYLVAYRKGVRYTRIMKPLPVITPGPYPVPARSSRNYVITGGTGALALELASHLADTNPQLRFFLLSRSRLPERSRWSAIQAGSEASPLKDKVAKLLEIEKKAGSVQCYAVDVSDYDRLEAVLAQIRSSCGGLHGVVHCAGVAGKGYFLHKNLTELRRVVKAKVQGVINLDLLTGKDELDFFITFSSVNAVAGEAGQSDYSLGNAFLDGYVRNMKRKNAVTLNWCGWSEVGMAAASVAPAADLFKPLTPSRALAAFDLALLHQQRQIILGELDVALYRKTASDHWFRYSRYLPDTLVSAATRSQPMKAAAKKTPTQTIRQIWLSLFELSEISIDTPFFQAGGDSIFAAHLIKRIDAEYPDVVDIADIYSYPTIRTMANFINSRISGQNAGLPSSRPNERPALAGILADLYAGKLSAAEAEGLIDFQDL